MAEQSAQAGALVDPYRAYNFKLDIQGVTQGHFTQCSPMGIKVDALSYREGGQNQIVHRLAGRVEYADVTLRYGLTDSKELWTWMQTGVQGKVERKNVSIVMVGNDGATETPVHWNLLNAWVSEWRGAPLDALGREIAIESMTLVFDSLERG